jgi:hypothetical protein
MPNKKSKEDTILILDKDSELGTDSDLFDPNLVIGFCGETKTGTCSYVHRDNEVKVIVEESGSGLMEDAFDLQGFIEFMKDKISEGWVFRQYPTFSRRDMGEQGNQEVKSRVIVPVDDGYMSVFGNLDLHFNLSVGYSGTEYFTFALYVNNNTQAPLWWHMLDSSGKSVLSQKYVSDDHGSTNFHEVLFEAQRVFGDSISFLHYDNLHHKLNGLKKFFDKTLK